MNQKMLKRSQSEGKTKRDADLRKLPLVSPAHLIKSKEISKFMSYLKFVF